MNEPQHDSESLLKKLTDYVVLQTVLFEGSLYLVIFPLKSIIQKYEIRNIKY